MITIRSAQPKLKILTADVECTPMTVKTYSLKVNGYISPKAIVSDWNLLGAAWKWLGEDRCPAISVSHRDTSNDYEVVGALHNVISEADMIIGHNFDKFDLKKFNTRCLKHGIPPVPPKRIYDTLKKSRKYFDLPSHSLYYVCKFLGLDPKDEAPDWDKVMAGDVEEIRKMRTYNRQDVISNEQLYLKIRAFDHQHPDLNGFHPIRDTLGEKVHVCPNCLSPNLRNDSPVYNKRGKLVRYLYQCLDCNRWSYK